MEKLKELSWLTTSDGITNIEPVMVVVVLLVSLLLGLVMKALYFNYYQSNEPLDTSIPRSFPMIAPAVTSIFWLIQYSLPLSLGLLGALSFVRFRTPVKRAEDIAFILVVIACSLSIAVFKFTLTIGLILVTFLYGHLRRRFPVLEGKSSQHTLITVNSKETIDVENLLADLRGNIPNISVISFSSHDGLTSVVFNVPEAIERLLEKVQGVVREFDQNARIDVFYPNQHLGGH